MLPQSEPLSQENKDKNASEDVGSGEASRLQVGVQ